MSRLVNIMFKLTPFPSYLIVVAILGSIACSCKSTKVTSGYFETLKKDTSISRYISPDLETKIQAGDVLGILFKSLNIEENARYNSGAGINITGTNLPAYPVDADGNIKVNRLGTVKVAGMTRRELARKLETDILLYLKDPIAEISFLNHKITVIGSIVRPQVLNLVEEKITLLDAIALSGDLTPGARKEDIMIIRNSNDQKIIKHINLSEHSIFNSPWYYLQAEDIVYVPTDYSKEEKEERRRRLQTNLSLAASGLSLLIIIIDRLTR